jgi:hypothetical protein
MPSPTASKGPLTVRAHRGDAKTLLAFNLTQAGTKNLAGFTIRCMAPGQGPFYLFNDLQFEKPANHAQVATEPANSSVNAPIHKFRWLHVPGSAHQGTHPVFGQYRYTVTPRYFDGSGSMLPIDPARGASVTVDVGPFEKKNLALGFARGYVQSQAFVRHFGPKAQIRPKGKDLLFDTSQEAGRDPQGKSFTYGDEYAWLGFTARQRVFEILDEVAADKSLWLDVFAYDLNEPDVLRALLALAKQGRVRVILDNAALHHSSDGGKPEDQFQALFEKAMKGGAGILRGKFGRYAHDKILIVSTVKGAKKTKTAVKVLTGSTNLSVTGVYVNSNHVLVFDDPKVADVYSTMFDTVWTQKASKVKFAADAQANQTFSFPSGVKFDVTFSPHDNTFTDTLLASVVTRVEAESKKANGSVLFAVMQLDKGTGPVLPALRDLHKEEAVFSYGISDSPGGVVLYKPGTKGGLLVTGKPAKTQLPKPFNQVPGVGLGHQVHHKFIVCGFDRDDAVVYCGSSNLAAGGEENNGDNLLAVHDRDVATVFAIEALALVDHFNFLDRASSGSKNKAPNPSKHQAAIDAAWFLSTDDKWAKPYFDANDLRSVDRRLFA